MTEPILIIITEAKTLNIYNYDDIGFDIANDKRVLYTLYIYVCA